MEKALTQFESLFLELLTPFLPLARQLSKDCLHQSVLKSSVEFWASDLHGYAKDSGIFDPCVDITTIDVTFPFLTAKLSHHWLSHAVSDVCSKLYPAPFSTVFLCVETLVCEILSYLVFFIDITYNGNSTLFSPPSLSGVDKYSTSSFWFLWQLETSPQSLTFRDIKFLHLSPNVSQTHCRRRMKAWWACCTLSPNSSDVNDTVQKMRNVNF